MELTKDNSREDDKILNQYINIRIKDELKKKESFAVNLVEELLK